MRTKFTLLLMLIGATLFAQLSPRYPTNVRYIGGGYTNRTPYFNSVKAAFQNVLPFATLDHPFVLQVDSDTLYITDWNTVYPGCSQSYKDSINNYYAGRIIFSGFVRGSAQYDLSGYVTLRTNQAISGIKTFNEIRLTPEFVPEGYVPLRLVPVLSGTRTLLRLYGEQNTRDTVDTRAYLRSMLYYYMTIGTAQTIIGYKNFMGGMGSPYANFRNTLTDTIFLGDTRSNVFAVRITKGHNDEYSDRNVMQATNLDQTLDTLATRYYVRHYFWTHRFNVPGAHDTTTTHDSTFWKGLNGIDGKNGRSRLDTLKNGIVDGVITPADTHTVHYLIPRWKFNTVKWKDSISVAMNVIDKTLWSLIVYTDTTQLVIVDTVLKVSHLSNGTHSFTTTSSRDSVYIHSTFASTDNIFLQPINTTYNVNDILFVEKHTHYIIVHRNTGGTSGLSYSWQWIKRY